MDEVKGYKVFESDWTCKDFQYSCPGIFEEDVIPKVCVEGFHFCINLSDCFEFCDFTSENKVAEVIALGKVDFGEKKCCTNKIQIVREIPWDEVVSLVNTGEYCTGLGNTGNRNSGDYNTGNDNSGSRNTGVGNTGDYNVGSWNTGDYNVGKRNVGDHNTGNWNTGSYNSGFVNTGDKNIGNKNTGYRNIGHCNTGDWNKSSHNTGCFMTIEPKISMFNKPSSWTYSDWMYSSSRRLLRQIPKKVTVWVPLGEMTDEEKIEYPQCATTNGYLKVLDEAECAQLWWDNLKDNEKEIIKALPNFDPEIFRECTGIKVD